LRKPFDILLVEDNPADVEITLEAFRRSQGGNHVHVCRDGEDAQDFLLGEGRYAQPKICPRPDLVLLDLNLPGRSGFDVLELMRRTEQLRNIPVVVLTTSDRDEDIQRCYRGGANSYLTKPVQFDDCLHLVAEIQRYWLHLNRLPPP